MTGRSIALIIVVLLLPLWGYLAYRWWTIFNSPDGERYLKQRMQGPWVPLNKDDLDSDDARRR